MSTQSQTQVSQYFTNTKIEEETEAIRVEKERQAGLWNSINSNDNDGDNDEGSETGFDSSGEDDDFNEEIDGDLDRADENIV
jgi:hypothetical protein